MSGSGYYVRLAAVAAGALVMGLFIALPQTGREAAERAAAAKPSQSALLKRGCALGAAPLSGPFAPIEDVLSISPLGAVTAPGEPLPAPFIRLNTRQGASVFERRTTTALAPARADIVAIERRVERAADGAAKGQSWTLRFRACDGLAFHYDRLDAIDAEILDRAGGLAAFAELGGPDHLAVETVIRVREGDVVGTADGFDIGLIDTNAAPATMARPERYYANPYQHAAVFDAPATLLAAITPDVSRARCALDYLPAELRDAWSEKLGDSWGMRSAKGEDACRSALIDAPEAAQGAWFTDASHNALADKISAIALAPDAIDPERLVLALHGRLKSLTPEMVALAPGLAKERESAARDFLTFERGEGRINAPFDAVNKGEVYCYQGLRANFVGPKIVGVILIEVFDSESAGPLMKMEARGDAMACADLSEPWAFTGAETTFYR